MASIGFRVIFFDTVDSTNKAAWEILRNEDLDEGTIIRAGFQTAGKGLGGTSWESEEGKNLTFSLVLKPAYLPVSQQFTLNQAIAIALCEAISEFCPEHDVHIKWPNDIYIGNRKLAGILIENSIMNTVFKVAVVGIGININQRHFKSNAPNPVSLFQLLGKTLQLDNILNTIYHHFEKWIVTLKQGRKKYIQRMYLNRLLGYGQTQLFQAQERIFKAKITGVSEYGKLILTENGIETAYDTKELAFLINSR